MSMRSKGEIGLEANECAARIGLSKRALRLYEEHGLIRPRRTQKGWRLYGADEIARLHEILALKRLGLSLQRITALLQRRQANDREAGRASGDAKPVPEDRSYNSFRPHSSLGNQTSVEPERSRLFVIAGPQVGQAQHRRTLT